MPDLPYGFDRADGLEGRLGTATPENSIIVHSGGSVINLDDLPIEEQPDSPTIERAEQATITKVFRMSWNEAKTRIEFLGRGSVVTDSYGNIYLVLSCTIQHEKGGMAIMTIVMEAKTFDSPPDEFSVTPVELGINLLKHPRYFYAFFGDGYGSTTEQRNQMVIRLLQDYFDNTSAQHRDAILKLLQASIGSDAGVGVSQPPLWDPSDREFPSGAKVAGTDMAKRAGMEIVQKFWRGEDTPYIVGWEVVWSQFVFIQPALDPGGRIEDPMFDATPQLPAYFFSRVFPPDDGVTIFDLIAQKNPQCYSDDGTPDGAVNISWLRKADQREFQRTWFKITRTWIGSPVGFWDLDLYSTDNRPSVPDDYRLLNA